MTAKASAASKCESTDEDRQPAKEPLLPIREQVIAPGDRAAQRPLPFPAHHADHLSGVEGTVLDVPGAPPGAQHGHPRGSQSIASGSPSRRWQISCDFAPSRLPGPGEESGLLREPAPRRDGLPRFVRTLFKEWRASACRQRQGLDR